MVPRTDVVAHAPSSAVEMHAPSTGEPSEYSTPPIAWTVMYEGVAGFGVGVFVGATVGRGVGRTVGSGVGLGVSAVWVATGVGVGTVITATDGSGVGDGSPSPCFGATWLSRRSA